MRDKDKNRLRWYLIITVLVLIIIPIIIDRFLAHEWYMAWCGKIIKVESPMEVGEWFGFLGSYLGVVGTIFIGIIAYWQTHIINKQSEGLNELQSLMAQMQQEIMDFQIHPIIHIKETVLYVRDGSRNLALISREIKDHYFSIYGVRQDTKGMFYQYIMMEISFEDKSVIPTVRCEVVDFEWEIAGNRYSVKLDESKRKLYASDKIHILIDDSDFGEKEEEKAFFRDLDLHEHYVNNGKRGYNVSILRLKIKFVNQKEYWQQYSFTYRMKSESGEIKADSLYLKSEEGGYNETK